jgi:hypothetical protein
MKRGPVIAEIAAWTLFFPVAIVLMAARLLGHGRKSPEQRIDALLAWYPAAWRARHGEALAELLRDATAGGRDGFLMSVDVAREGLTERVRAFRWQPVRAGFLIGTGSTMLIPQGIVAAILSQFDLPRSWFLALYVGQDARWLVVGFMVGAGLLLIERGTRIYTAGCHSRASSAG